MFKSLEAALIRQNVAENRPQTARKLTRALLDSGRVSCGTDMKNNGVKIVLVDGEPVGQMSVLSAGMEFSDLMKIKGIG